MPSMFARHSIPLEVSTDGSTPFTSHEFNTFARVYDFTHVIPIPQFPRSNGLAEEGVQVIKRLLKKTNSSSEDLWIGLIN